MISFVKGIAETIENDWIGDKMNEIIKVVSDLIFSVLSCFVYDKAKIVISNTVEKKDKIILRAGIQSSLQTPLKRSLSRLNLKTTSNTISHLIQLPDMLKKRIKTMPLYRKKLL